MRGVSRHRSLLLRTLVAREYSLNCRDQIDGRSPLAAVRPACGSVSVTAPRDDGTELSDSEGFVALTRQAACDGANHGRKDTD